MWVNVTHKRVEAEWKEYGADKILSHEYVFTEVPRHWVVCNIIFGIPIWFGIGYISYILYKYMVNQRIEWLAEVNRKLEMEVIKLYAQSICA